MPHTLMSTTALSLLIQVPEHRLRRLSRRGLLPFVAIGSHRAYRESDLPRIRRVCREHGALPKKQRTSA